MVKFDEKTKEVFFSSAASFLIREDVTTHKYKTFLGILPIFPENVETQMLFINI